MNELYIYAIFAYLFLAGMIYEDKPQGKDCIAALFMGLIAPISLPFMLGIMVIEMYHRNHKP